MSASKRNRLKVKKSKTGLPPGMPIYIGVERDHRPTINLISFNLDFISEKKDLSMEQIKNLDPNKNHWINVHGVYDVNMVQTICTYYKVQSLNEEDILNTTSRPKSEIFDEYIFTELKIIKNELPNVIVEDEQFSLILFKNVLISFQETNSAIFTPIINRLHNPESRARRKNVDFLYSSLLDMIIDMYMDVMEEISQIQEKLEEEIISGNSNTTLSHVQSLKSDLLYLKKLIFPLREAILKITRSETKLIEKDNLKYYNDLYDHLMYVIDNIETQRELVVGLRELYMSTLSNGMNNVMKVLTMITSIFIPLSFIAGVYGMNFDVMPELRHPYGYFYTLGFMALLAIGMIIYFKRKKWM